MGWAFGPGARCRAVVRVPLLVLFDEAGFRPGACRVGIASPEGATVTNSRGCRRGPQDRGKPTVRRQSRSSPTGGECACARIEGTAIVRPSGHAVLVDGRIAWQGLRPAASAVCATPAGVGRLACCPGVCAALRPPATRWHASGMREARDRHLLRHGPATRSWPRRPKHGNNRLTDRAVGAVPQAVVDCRVALDDGGVGVPQQAGGCSQSRPAPAGQ